MIHTVETLQFWSSNETNFMVGAHHNVKTVLKGNSMRKVENLWLKGRGGFSLMLGCFISWVIFVNERCQTFGEGRYAHSSVTPKSQSRTFPGPTMPFPSQWWILRSGGNQSVSWFSGDLGILSIFEFVCGFHLIYAVCTIYVCHVYVPFFSVVCIITVHFLESWWGSEFYH